jgi:hypothetical protein
MDREKELLSGTDKLWSQSFTSKYYTQKRLFSWFPLLD